MGAGDESSPAKNAKPSLLTQEVPTPSSYQDWSNIQAYYGAPGTPPFFASTVPSPAPHPYMWGGQHPMMPPYGTPVPYPALYPPAGVYAHPSMTSAPSTTPPNAELEGKSTEGKERTVSKKSKGAMGNANYIGGRSGENGKAASSSGNDGATQSAESGSDSSSDATGENNERHEFHGSKKGSFHQMLADANSHNTTPGSAVAGNPVPATTMNMGMDLWNASSGPGAIKGRPNAVVGREGMMPDQWVQDERELKRQKRKQSNRESARRSRLRKQAECEELQTRVELLNSENNTLRDELRRLSDDCEKLTSENNKIKDELTRLCGPEAISKLDNNNGNMLHKQSRGGEGNS